jgi:hypothetical protein
MITAYVMHGGRTYSIRIANGDAFDLVAKDEAGAVLWKARLSTPQFCVREASIRTLERGEIEVRARGQDVKDDSMHELVWRYTRDGALTVGARTVRP